MALLVGPVYDPLQWINIDLNLGCRMLTADVVLTEAFEKIGMQERSSRWLLI